MSEQTLQIGVILARRSVAGVWATTMWRPAAVLPSPVALAPGARIAAADDAELFYAGGHELTLHRCDTASYRDNLLSGEPRIWVTLALDGEPPRVVGITADPYEGEALAEIYGDRIEATAMPRSVQDVLAGFVQSHHVERPFIKRKRR